jgi:tRNA(fMet)-specific endonuclease VapC
MKFMLDTSICIYIIKKKPAKVVERFRRTEVSQIGISAITLSELFYGVSKSSAPKKNHVALVQFSAPLVIWPYDDKVAQCYGDLRARLEKQGTPIGALDMLIGAHALSLSCTLVTSNDREFVGIPNLRIDNWVGPNSTFT